MNTQKAFPLSWPIGWKRTPAHLREAARFSSSHKRFNEFTKSMQGYSKPRSMNLSTEGLLEELGRLSAGAVVVSTNVELRLDGLPYANRPPPADPGVAVYFKLDGQETVLACDKWTRVEDNIWAIKLHIEAMRGQIRWGVGTVNQAFAGYKALPQVGASHAATWYSVLNCSPTAGADEIKAAWRKMAKAAHPDNGGNHDWIAEVNRAYEQGLEQFASPL